MPYHKRIITFLACCVMFLNATQAFAVCLSHPVFITPGNVLLDYLPDGEIEPGTVLNTFEGEWFNEYESNVVFDLTRPNSHQASCINNVNGADRAYMQRLGRQKPGIFYHPPGSRELWFGYDTGIKGIAYAIGIKDINAPPSKNDDGYLGATAAKRQTYPYPGGPTTPRYTIGYKFKVVFLATGEKIASGTYTIPAQQMATLSVEAASGVYVPPPTAVHLAATTFTVGSQGCTITTPERQLVQMPEITLGYDNLADPKNSARFAISLNCDRNVALYATMSDVHHPLSTDSYLRPSPSSTARGVGIQLFKYDEVTPIRFGPDSAKPGNINQWLVGGKSSSIISPYYTIPFIARYAILPEHQGNQGGYKDITPGEFHAEASITFSYQ